MTEEKSTFFTKKHIIIMIIALLLCIGIVVGIWAGVRWMNGTSNDASSKEPVYGYLQIIAGEGESQQTILQINENSEITYNSLQTEESEATLSVSRGQEAYDSINLAIRTMDGAETVYESELVFEEDEDTTEITLTDLMQEEYCLYVCVLTDEQEIYYVSQMSDFISAATGAAQVITTEGTTAEGTTAEGTATEDTTAEDTATEDAATEDAVTEDIATEDTKTDDAAEAADRQIILLTDLEDPNEELVLLISEAQTWDLNGHSLTMAAPISFVSEEEGTMCIYNEGDTLVCGSVTCDTPHWAYEITEPFGNFTETGFYYIYAESINGAAVDCSSLYLDSAEKLDSYVADGVFDASLLPEQTTALTFSGEYEIEGFALQTPMNLTFMGDISVSDMISAKFSEDATWSIDTSENGTSLADHIVFDTPGTAVTWTGDDCMEYDYAEQYMNFSSYNGLACSAYIGGAGKGVLTSGSLLAESGDWISFAIDGNYLSFTVSYINNVDLDDTQVSAVFEGDEASTAEIVSDGEDYYCITTDSEGASRGYKMIVTTKEYNLPVIYITTDDGAAITSQTTYKSATFTLDYNGTEDYTNIVDAEINIRGRGHSSWKLDKKPYKIKFEEKTSIFGLTEAKEWCLIANHVDYSLIRNTLAMEMAAELDNIVFVPTSHMVDVFVNGEYVGVYSICEQIEMKEGRIPGEKDSTEIDCDYLLEMGGDEKETSFGTNVFSTTLCTWETVNTPDESILSEEQYNYIKNYMQELDDAVISGEGYEEYIDIPSLIDYFILLEFSYNLDGAFRRSNYMLKKAGDKLYMAAPWDYDYAFGNMSLDTDTYDDWISLGNAKTDSYDNYISTNWMDYLLYDENFQTQLKARWEEVGETLYEKALTTIDTLEASVTSSAEDNFTVWDTLGTRIQYQSRKSSAYSTYAEQMEYLRNFIEKRYAWMDKTIRAM